MSLVEHALCPLDATLSLRPNFVHDSSYFYTDTNRNRRKAHTQVLCPQGLSAGDEFFLWGLLALTLSQPKPSPELFATPHFCLRQLGCIAPDSKGSRNYELFRESIARLAAVHYQNDHFYDPVRGEHRDVAFGFLSYSLPLNSDSARAWRFFWDPLFFEICQAGGGALSFDLEFYRQLDSASRRLYLLLKKIFWRHEVTPAFDVRHLCVNVLGFAPQLGVWDFKRKLVRVMDVLVARQIISPAPAGEPLFTKQGVGAYQVKFHRGLHFNETTADVRSANLADSPMHDQLAAIGFDAAGIRRILSNYDMRMISEWVDITLAARERHGDDFFTTSPQAYFIDNVKHAADGTRTPPDWWRQLRVEEERLRRTEGRSVAKQNSDRNFEEYLAHEAREAFDRVMQKIFTGLRDSGVSEPDAQARASYIARMNLRVQFRREHPEYREDD